MNRDYWIGGACSLLKWLFFHTIYGMLGVAILVYLLFRDLRKTFPGFPEPTLVAGLVFLVGVGTLPSIPRYQFHDEMLKLTLQKEDSAAVRGETGRIAGGGRLRPVHHQVYTTGRVGDPPPPRDALAGEDGSAGKGLVLSARLVTGEGSLAAGV